MAAGHPSVARTLGILSGAGPLPLRVAEAARDAGIPLFLIGIEGEADPAIAAFPHAYVRWGEVGRLFDLLKANDCHDLVIIGSVRRPSLKDMRFDLGAVRTLPRLLSMLVGGDDKVLSSAIGYIEERGFKVHGAHAFAPDLLMPAGALGVHGASRKDMDDIRLGLAVAGALGAFDVGQAVVVENAYVLALEAAEGTDGMLARVGELRRAGAQRSGVLVKRSKPAQELRVDMPTVGPRTVSGAAAAGLAGIAVEAGRTLLVERARLVAAADEAGLFVVGVAADG